MTVATRRSIVIGGLAATSALVLHSSSWSERFDPGAWIERWYRAGHGIAVDPDGRPMLLQNMDADEDHAAALRGEVNYFTNRHALRQFLQHFEPRRPGVFSTYARRRAS